MLKVGLKNKKGIKIDLPGTLKWPDVYLILFTFALLATFGCGGALVLLQHDVTVATAARTRTNLFFALDMSILQIVKIEFHYRTTLKYSPVH